MLQKIVLASGNSGKLSELRARLAPFTVACIAQTELGIAAPAEPFATFLENALVKARHAARESGLPALADDSGLCAAALDGAPGVFSARYAGEAATDAANNHKLIDAMRGRADRSALYVCVLAFVLHAADPIPLIAQGLWAGELIDQPRGDGGFGYDPHFLLPALGRTAAELTLQQKNAISHRGQAMTRFIEGLRERRLIGA